MDALRSFINNPGVHAAILGLIASTITYFHPVTDQSSALNLAGWIFALLTAWLFPSPVSQPTTASTTKPQVD